MLIDCILQHEFGCHVFRVLTRDSQISYSTYVQRETYETEKAESIEQLIDNKMQMVKSWPSNVSTSVIQSCLTNYRSASCYKQPMPCASCASSSHKTKMVFITVYPDKLLPLNLHILQLSDPFLINFKKNVTVLLHTLRLL